MAPGSAKRITQLDIDGHSVAYGSGADKDGPHGTGFASQVAEGLGLRENNGAFPGATLQETGIGTDGWGKVLRSNPRPAGSGKSALEALPRMALLFYGANDIVLDGPDLSIAKQAYRTIVARHRASAVYEAGNLADPSIVADPDWKPMEVAAGQASGQSVLKTTRPATLKIHVGKSALGDGSTVDLGFVQALDSSAHYTISVDGKRAGTLQTSPPLSPENLGYLPDQAYAPFLFRIQNLSPAAHTIEVEADRVNGEAGFDYWQIEPPTPEPVVLIKQYPLKTAEAFPGAPHLIDAGDIRAVNQMTDEVAKEFGPRVLTVDIDRAVTGTPGAIFRDQVHLSQRGSDAVAQAVLKAIRESDFAVELPRRNR